MKKFFVVVLSIVFLVGFSVSAFAKHATPESEYNPGMTTKDGVQIEMSGSIRSRGEFRSNTADLTSDIGDNRSSFDTRVRLKFKARVSPRTMAVLELESGGDTSDTYGWGTTDGATGFYRKGNAKRGTLSIRQAYVSSQFNLAGNTAGLKVGHMLLGLGNGLFYDHTKFGDDAAILWTQIPGTDGEISFVYAKFNEGASSVINDDSNVYVLALEYPTDMVNISADATYIDDQDFTGAAPGATDGLHFWNFGLRGDASVAGVNLKGDLEFQTGTAENAAASGNDLDAQGWGFLVAANTEISGITVGAEIAYGSGDDTPGDDDLDLFVTSLGGSQHYTYVYEYRTVAASGSTGSGLQNTWYVNVGASTQVTPDLKVSGDVYYLQASEDVTLMGSTVADDELGWEIDSKIEYEIDKNLLYYIEGGYFFPGDAYANGDGDDAYAVRNGIVLKF